MKYSSIDSKLFIENRKRFVKNLKPNSIALFVSNDVMTTNADGTMGFVQNSDLFYLSGIDQEETILLIYPDAITNEHKEILFVKETNEGRLQPPPLTLLPALDEPSSSFPEIRES